VEGYNLLGNLKDKKRVWTKLGAVRLEGTMEQLASYDSTTGNVTFANGFVPTTGCYVLTNATGDTLVTTCKFTLVEDGVYTMKNLDNAALTGKTYDITTTYVQNPEARALIIQNFDTYDQYKVRVSSPLYVTHGARQSYIFGKTGTVAGSWGAFNPYTSLYLSSGHKIIYEAETFSAGDDTKPNLRYVKQSGQSTKTESTHSRYNAVKLYEYDFTKDKMSVNGVTTMRLHHWNDIMTIGTYFELWGKNDE